MQANSSSSTSATTPVYNEKRMSVRDWEGEFKDFARGKNFLGIVLGTEDHPDAHKNWQLDRAKQVQDYLTRKRLTFFALCESMKPRPTIYKSSVMDSFGDEADPDAEILAMLRPNDVDVRMAIMCQINSLGFKNTETMFELINRYDALVANLPKAEMPDDLTKFLHIKMAIFGNSKTRDESRNTVEALEIQGADYRRVCKTLVRKLTSLITEETLMSRRTKE